MTEETKPPETPAPSIVPPAANASPKKLVSKEFDKPCGCHIVEFSDGSANITPCVPCAFLEAARALGGAAQAIGAVAHRIRAEQQQAAMMAAVQAGVGGRKKGLILPGAG